MTASYSEQTGNQGMQGIPLQYTALHLKDFTHKFGLDSIVAVKGRTCHIVRYITAQIREFLTIVAVTGRTYRLLRYTIAQIRE